MNTKSKYRPYKKAKTRKVLQKPLVPPPKTPPGAQSVCCQTTFVNVSQMATKRQTGAPGGWPLPAGMHIAYHPTGSYPQRFSFSKPTLRGVHTWALGPTLRGSLHLPRWCPPRRASSWEEGPPRGGPSQGHHRTCRKRSNILRT